MKALHVILAVAGAAVAGAAAGILLAPRKGEETRENIVDFVKSHYPGVKQNRLEALADQIAREVKEADE